MNNNILENVWINDLLNYVFPSTQLANNYNLVVATTFLAINEYKYYKNYDKDIIFIKVNTDYSHFGSKIKDLVFDKLTKRGFNLNDKKFKSYVEKEFYDIVLKTNTTNVLVEHYLFEVKFHNLHCIVLNHDKGELNE
jgi:hypothetical protein